MQFLFGDYSLDTARRELRRGPTLIAMEPQVFDLLIYLVQNRDRVVSKDDMIAAVWHSRIVSESTLTSRITAVRKAVGDSGKEQALIRTIARKGIRFVGLVAEGSGKPGEPAGEYHDTLQAGLARARLDFVTHPLAGAPTQQPAPPLNNLPLRRASFLGREHDVSSVTELLETTNLVTLTGAGGIGKTSLSLEIATGLLDKFRDGVWFAGLAPVADAKLVPSAVADALAVNEEPGRPLLSTLLNFLRDRRLLIVLDNCEHLTDACARLADAVLQVSSQTRILATSREPLGIGGELIWRVSSLPTPDPGDPVSAADLARYPAARLFIERAKFARPSFQVTNDNAPFISRICWQLDGIPLAIELAASRVAAMQVEQIVERLGDRFRLLTGGSRAAMPHQQTLLSTIDWSFSLLSEAERVLLCRLSTFSGGWTLEAAEAVCAGDGLDSHDVLDALAHLIDKSLVVLDERVAEPRYRMLETIRQYGQGKLHEAGSVGQLNNRHLQYYTAFAEFIEPHFYHPDQTHWYAKADRELDNFRAALEWSLTEKRIDFGMRLVSALHRYWVARVYWMEATGWLQRLLARIDLQAPTPLHAKTMFIAGHITNYYDPARAQQFADDTLRLARALDYKEGIVNALWLIGWLHHPRLDGSAVPYFEESIRLARAIDYIWGAMHAYAWYGMYMVGVGDYEAAKPVLREGLVQAERIGGDASLLGRCEGNLGQAAMLQGDFATAKLCLDKSLALTRGAGNRNGIAESLWLQGRLALRQHDFALALRYLKESLALYRTHTTSVWVTRGLIYIAITHIESGQLALAAQLVGALDARDNSPESINTHLGSLASIAEYQNAVANLRAKMPGASFDVARKAGYELAMEQSIELALA